MSASSDRPDCFSDLDIVFPLGADGLRITPESCMQCAHRTPCLRMAMGGGRGWRVREEMVDRAYRGGVIGFFQRWSQKKNIARQRKSIQEECHGENDH